MRTRRGFAERLNFTINSSKALGIIWVLTVTITTIFICITQPFPQWYILIIFSVGEIVLLVLHWIYADRISRNINYDGNKAMIIMSIFNLIFINFPLFASQLIISLNISFSTSI